MFEVSLVELAVIALVALLVLGPEKLPRAARTAGLYLRKARASWHSIRTDIERELAAEDLKSALKDTRRQLRSSAQDIGDGLQPTPASTKTASAAPASEPATAPEAPAPARSIGASSARQSIKAISLFFIRFLPPLFIRHVPCRLYLVQSLPQV